MKLTIASAALLVAGVVAAGTENARAAVYCQDVGYTAGCVVRPGVVAAPTRDVRKIPPTINAAARGSILRQDLFDRNNPQNLRLDWATPPAQPGQY
jgi:hypothetical protein